jgi:hypothetical protein
MASGMTARSIAVATLAEPASATSTAVVFAISAVTASVDIGPDAWDSLFSVTATA